MFGHILESIGLIQLIRMQHAKFYTPGLGDNSENIKIFIVKFITSHMHNEWSNKIRVSAFIYKRELINRISI